jgi:glycogen operon protein
VEKLPYLKELGITALELLPVYEFLEREQKQQTALTMEEMKENYKTDPAGEPGRINYWGYKDAYYFAPKASYSAGKHSDISFKEMVKALHKSGIEVILQFYFSPQVSQAFIAKVCRYWVQEYHIDGIRLLGVGVPLSLIGDDPLLWNTKIMYEHVEDRAIQPQYKHMASYNDGYMYAMRHFLKGDVGSLHQAFDAFLASSDQTGNVVYLTNYNTFTLNDLVSYGRKHNEANGENGRDGCDDNVSWNCGMEGPARKKQITLLREKQMKNALAMLILSKGTPVIMAGDEFANSQNGNNNPYCQDNAVSWLNWKDLTRNQEQFQYTCKLIHLVKEFPILKQTSGRKNGELYPSLSFHGREAWKLAWDQSNEEAGGILYYGAESCIYLCFNMNWEETALAIPNLPGEITWELLLDTACPDRKCPDAAGETKTEWTKEDKAVAMAPRSIKIIAVKGSMKFDHEGVSAF